MTSSTTGIAHALAALVGDPPDLADVLQHLVVDAAAETGAGAAAVLAEAEVRLTLVSASSHRTAELEMLQAHQAEGPCVESIATGTVVRSTGADDLTARWPEVGAAVVRAGFSSVEAFPVRWRGRSIAGLNLFYDGEPSVDLDHLKQGYADVAALAVATGTWHEREDVTRHLAEIVDAREVVEVAKGVLAEQRGVSVAEAHELLLRVAADTGWGVTAAAREVVARRGLPTD